MPGFAGAGCPRLEASVTTRHGPPTTAVPGAACPRLGPACPGATQSGLHRHRLPHGPAGHDVIDLTQVDGLEAQQCVCHGVELVHILHQDAPGTLVVAVDDHAHCLVDRLGGFGGDLALLGHRMPRKTSPSSSP